MLYQWFSVTEISCWRKRYSNKVTLRCSYVEVIAFKIVRSSSRSCLTLRNIYISNDNGGFPFFFLYHRQDFHLTWRYIWVTRRVSYMEQELLTFREQLSLRPVLMRYVLLIFSVFCVVFVCLRRIYVCPILPVSLDCPFLIAPVVFSNVYLFACLRRIYVLYALSCQCLWIVHSWLPLLFSLTFICLLVFVVYMSCMPYLASVSGLSILDCPCCFL